jgi:hypothetical protein
MHVRIPPEEDRHPPLLVLGRRDQLRQEALQAWGHCENEGAGGVEPGAAHSWVVGSVAQTRWSRAMA